MRLWTNRSKCSRWLAVGLVFFAAWATGQDLARKLGAWKAAGMANKHSRACSKLRPPLLTILFRCAPTPSSWTGITIRLRARFMPGSVSFCNEPAPQPGSAPQ